MTQPKSFLSPGTLALTGVIVFIVAVSLTFGQSYSVNHAIENLQWLDANRSIGDSTSYASAVVHASAARESYEGRWGLTGYMTLGMLGTALGVALVVVAVRQANRQRRPQGAA